MTKDLKNKAIKIKGKDYVLVADRVIYFNEEYSNGGINPSYDLIGDTYHFKAVITPDYDKPERTFTGHSQATIGDGMVNKTAAMENAETSAVGRALAMMGIGVIDSIASADEMNKATGSKGSSLNKTATEKQIKWMRDTAARVFGLENQYDIDEAIKSVLTIPVDKVPLTKVKSAVDKIEASKPEVPPLNLDDVELSDEDLKKADDGTLLDDIPY